MLPKEFEPLALPSDGGWASVGLRCGPELHAGRQSRVFRAVLDGGPIVVKLSDGRLADQSFFRRIELLASLAEVTSSVVGPIPIRSSLVNRVDQWLVVAYPYVSGEMPDVTSQRDVIRLASALAELHQALARHEPVDLPVVAALRAHHDPHSRNGFGPPQLLHGDFSNANTLWVNHQLRIFDFDDCGYGPLEFEVGNSLYMVLFDAFVASDLSRYERFREWFVGTYRSESGSPVTDAALDSALEMRVRALDRWVNDPGSAPIGIRTSTPEWRGTLRAFVDWNSMPAP